MWILCLSMMFVVAIAVFTIVKKGFPGRTNEIYSKSLILENAHNPVDPAALQNCKDCPDIPNCNQIVSLAQPTIALVGDSHAQHLFVGLKDHYKSTKENLAQFEACSPLNTNLIEGGQVFSCSAITDSVFRYIAKTKTIHTVILSWYGQMMFSGGRYKQKVYRDLRFKDDPSNQDQRVVYVKALRQTIDYLLKSRKKVILVMDNPDLGFNPLNDLRPFSFFHTPDSIKGRMAFSEYQEYSQPYTTSVKKMLKDFPQVSIFEPSKILCSSGYCYGIKEGKLLYFDPDHLTREGSMLLGKSFPF